VDTYSNIGMLSVYVLKICYLATLKMLLLNLLCLLIL